MAEQQITLGLDDTYSLPPAVVPDLQQEIAQVWSLPLGDRVEVCFRGSQRSAVVGTLELVTVPDYPWDAHQPLQLRIAGFIFSTRDIGSWTRV